MDMADAQTQPQPGFLTRILLKIAAVDEATLRLCPPQDWDNARAVGEIMLFSWFYQAALFGVVGHRLFAAPGQIRPELILVAVFLATFVLLIDSYMVMRSGWHLSGINELKRGGIDIGGGPGARIKAGIFLAVRIGLSICLAQLTAIFLSLLIFGSTIEAQLDAVNDQANAGLVQAATATTDAAIQRATAAVTAETSREAALSGQVADLRQTEIDPASGDAQVQQARHELDDAIAAKAKADGELQAAESFSTAELGGASGSGHSGIVGDGIHHKAALEAVADARRRADDAARAVDAARGRLEAFRRQVGTNGKELRQRAHDQLPASEAALTAEEVRLADVKQQLATLVQGRSAAIRDAVEHIPGYVVRDNGLLAQVAALKQFADRDLTIKTVIILIDVISFAFELAAVLAKVTAFVPTTYAALLARDAYLQVVRIVNSMMAELGDEPDTEAPTAPTAPAHGPADSFGSGFADMPANPFDAATAPLKRPRGRPRKTVLN